MSGGSGTGRAPSIERIRQEDEVAAGFLRVLQRRVDELAGGGGVSAFELEEPERKVLFQINNSGLLKGSAAGILSLVFLRRVRSSMLHRIAQRIRQQQQRGGGGGGAQSPFQQQPMAGPQAVPSASEFARVEAALRRRPWSPANLFGWFLDLSAAFFIAATSSIVFTDRKMVLQNLSTLPLIEGKSRVAAELCPSMVEHYRELQRQQSPATELLNDPQTDYLRALRAFCVNCQRRRKQEAQLRATMGMEPTAVVSIPPPGVTVSDTDDDLWRDDDNDNTGTLDGSNDFYDFPNDDKSTQWADEFVSDQDETENRRK